MIGLRDETGSAPPPPSHAPALAAKIFAEDGWLQTGLKLDHRPQQEEMARAVATAMRATNPSCSKPAPASANLSPISFPG